MMFGVVFGINCVAMVVLDDCCKLVLAVGAVL